MFKKIISFALIFCILLVVPTSSFTTEEYITFEGEDGELLKLYLIEEEDFRTSEVYDVENNLVASFTYYTTNNLIIDNITGEINEAPSIAENIEDEGINNEKNSMFCDISEQNFTKSEPNFCNKGNSYTVTHYSTVGKVLSISAAVALTSAVVVAKLAAFLGTKVVTSIVASGFVSALISAAVNGNINKNVTIKVKYNCRRYWESDPFHPGGGFYFYGYAVGAVTGTV